MSTINLKGCGTALVTPFKDGGVDYEAFRMLVRRQVEGGIDYLLPLGTTGETPCLSDEERIELLKITKEEAKGRPVIVGGGTNSLTDTIRSMKVLEPYGPDAFLIVVPYYNKPTQEGMYQYFKAVAAATEKPIILYNVPGRTGSNLLPQTCVRLAKDVRNIVGIKEASGNYFQAMAILKDAPEDFQLVCGDDALTLAMMKAGAAGVFSVASNVAPDAVARLTHYAMEGKFQEAEELNLKLNELYTVCFIESNPIPAKTALFQLGLCQNEFRLPMCPATEDTVKKVAGMLETLKSWQE